MEHFRRSAAWSRATVLLPGMLLSLLPASAQLLNVDFNQNNGVAWGGGGPNPGPTMSGAAVLGQAGNHWNGITVNAGAGLPLRYADGGASPVTLTFTSGGGYDVNSFGGSSPFAHTSYASLMEDYLYNGGTPQTVTLAGLRPNTSFHLVLYSAADAGAAGRTTFVTVKHVAKHCVWDGITTNLTAGVNYVDFPAAWSDNTGQLPMIYCGDGAREGDLNGFQIQASPVKVAVSAGGGNWFASFAGQAGFTYQWQIKANLDLAAWTPFGAPEMGSNATQSLTRPLGTGERGFYRLQITTNSPPTPSFLHTSGTNLVNESGFVVQLRGMNLGGWLVMEKWMCPLDSGNLADTYSVMTNLDQRFGVPTEQSLINSYRTNWLNIDDLDNLSNAGFNCVRVPVWWGNFYSLTNTTLAGWRPDAFGMLDWLVTNCAPRGIYVILDLHGVIGGQSISDDTGWANQNRYWTNSLCQSQTADLWRQIAGHFKGNPTVAGYDLINEPSGAPNTTAVWSAYTSLYNAVRGVDPGHIVILEGTFGNWKWNMLPAPSQYGWSNVVYSMHEYQWSATSAAGVEAGADNQVTDYDNHLAWDTPAYIGEWNNLGYGASSCAYVTNHYANAGVSWSMWSYKAAHGIVPDGWGWYDPVAFPTVPNIANSSPATIAADWQKWKTRAAFVRNISGVGF